MQRRRVELAEWVWNKSDQKGGFVILKGNNLVGMTEDTYYPFKQESNFSYLTDFNTEDAIFTMLVAGENTFKTVLYCKEYTAKEVLKVGAQPTLPQIQKEYGFTECKSIQDFDNEGEISTILHNGKLDIFSLLSNEGWNNKLHSWISDVVKLSEEDNRSSFIVPSLHDMLDKLVPMREIKSEEEIVSIQQACAISVRGHKEMMRYASRCTNEAELAALFASRTISCGGDPMQSYPPIIASGSNAGILHYGENDAFIKRDKLVLVDAGAAKKYASDITTTFPSSGKFTEEQKIIYELVLKAQRAGIKEARVGNHFNEPHRVALAIMICGLVDLGILKGNKRELFLERTNAKGYDPKAIIRRILAHHASHYVGLSVHDVGSRDKNLEGHEVITVEPGIYIGEERDVNPKWWNIFVRIEDTVLVSRDGGIILTPNLPRTVEEIEGFMEID